MPPRRPSWEPMPAAGALPAAFLTMLVIGAASPGVTRTSGEQGVLVLATAMVGGLSLVSTARAAAALAVMGWLTVVGFSRAPRADLQLHGTHPGQVAAVLLLVAALAWMAGAAARRTSGRGRQSTEGAIIGTLDGMPVVDERTWRSGYVRAGWSGLSWRGLGGAVSTRRRVVGLFVAVAALPLVTVVLLALRSHLALVDDVLVYLVTLIGITLIGGFWPAIAAAVAASLLLNWFFTPPLHHWTIEAPQNILALALFVAVAVIVSATVHVAARRAAVAAKASAEAETLLALARTVLAGADTPAAVVQHLARSFPVGAELTERVGGQWITVARTESDSSADDAGDVVLQPRPDLRLRVTGATQGLSARLLDGYAAQAAAALDRERLRIQASQAEALAAGNRMRTALLAAVSHDLRTPLASVKASVTSLRATDVVLRDADRAELLQTIEEAADRLDALIGNLLDMSRLQTGSLEPFLRPTALDEVAPLAVRGLDDPARVRLAIPDGLPLVATDPGLLDRVLANLLGNALRFTPVGTMVTLSAHTARASVVVEVIDHGPGIPAQERARVFEPFQRLGDQRTTTGVGLGLAVARGFTEAMGGTIEATDTPGGGLTMRVRLPVAGATDDVNASAPA